MQSQFWLNNPTILFYSTQIWPTKDMDKEEKLNAMTRLIILVTILLYLITGNIRVLVAGGATIIAIVALKYAHNNTPKETPEGFANLTKYTEPSQSNPLMNVLLPQIQDDPTRPAAEAAYKPDVIEQINKCTQEMVVNNFDNKDDIKKKLFTDLGDSFMFDRSMTQFNATANTTIPNDQKSFAEFCYGDMISCKEGNALACSRSTPPHWING